MFDSDLDTFLAEFGQRCLSGGLEFTAIFDRPDDVLGAASVGVVSTSYQLTAKASDVAAAQIVRGSTVTVDGVAYRVREALAQDDGSFSQLHLTRI
jgi:hypothetical protein